ncbi:hypothetical protein [Nocardia sp. CA-135398]|uniref:hypothetical protein n=1 Tax=Nocardia sp. CA-135398 TaxID=3239977 RepID=UPI003D952D6F
MSSNDLDGQYINRYAGRVENPEEVLMRADFARAEELRRTAWLAETEEERYLRFTKVRGIEASWSRRDDELGEAWWYLNDAHHDWLSEPDFMREFHDQIRADQAHGVAAISDMQWRSQQQAREMTGHGSWEQAAESAARSVLADYQPGHSLADAVARNGSQRDGAER